MADTIVTNSPGNSDSGAGMVVGLILVLLVVVGGIFLYQRGAFRAAAPAGGTNINVTIPNPTAGGTGGTTQ